MDPSSSQCNKARKRNKRDIDQKEKKKLSLYADDVTISVETPRSAKIILQIRRHIEVQ